MVLSIFILSFESYIASTLLVAMGAMMTNEQQITILESRCENLTAANSKLHEMIQNQIARIHELELQILKAQ